MALRFSELASYITCPTKWHWDWVINKGFTEPSPAQQLGTSIHKRIENGENVASYLEWVINPHDVIHEQQFEFYNEDFKIDVSGTIDLVSCMPDKNYIYDIKTTKSPSSNSKYNYPMNFLQVEWYCLNMTTSTKKESLGFILEIELDKAGTPMQTVSYAYNRKPVQEVLFSAIEKYKSKSALEKNPLNCKAYNTFCKYYEDCWYA